MKVSVQYAQEHFADLATAASRGEEVEIDCAGDVSFRLTLVKPAVKTTLAVLGENLAEHGRASSPRQTRRGGMLSTCSFWKTPVF